MRINIAGILGVLAATVLSSACTSKIVVRHVNKSLPDDAPRDGVYYALPKTVLLAEVPVMRSRTIKGEFTEVAHLFLPLLEPDSAASFSLDQPSLGTFGVPDASQVYLADIKGGRFEDKKLAMSFGEDGAVEKLEAESHNRTVEFVGQVVKSLGGIAGQLIKAGSADEPPPSVAVPKPCESVESAVRRGPKDSADDPLPSKAYQDCSDMEAAFQQAMAHYVTTGKDSAEKRTRARTFIRAHDAAKHLEELRRRRDQLLMPGALATTATDEPYKALLAALDKEMADILAAFTGTTEKKVYWKATFQVTPSAILTGDGTVKLFSYIPSGGICPAEASTQESLTLVENLPPPARLASCEAKDAVTVMLAITRPTGQYSEIVSAAADAASARTNRERGFYYRIPARAQVVLQTQRQEEREDPKSRTKGFVTLIAGLAQYSPSIAQFGTVVSLPATTGGRKTSYTADLYSATGALRTFKLASEAQIDKAIVTDVESAATTTLEANEARRTAERDRSDKLTQLKRQADILEAQVRIKAAQDTLKPPQPDPPE
jgi:hypothetical protein